MTSPRIPVGHHLMRDVVGRSHGSGIHELGGEAEVPEPDRAAAATVEEEVVGLDVMVRDPAAALESLRLVLDN
jgi:hypothetical protein